MFKVGDRVRTNTSAHSVKIAMKVEGTVVYIACSSATISGGQTCDKTKCQHPNKNYCWVRWPRDAKLYSYSISYLEYDDLQLKENKEQPVKDPYIEEAKSVITSKVSADKMDKFDFKMYNGFKRVIFDRRTGKEYIQELGLNNQEIESKNPITDLDFYSYNFNGIVKSKNGILKDK